MQPISIHFTIDPDAYLRMMRKVAFPKRYPFIGISLAIYFAVMLFRSYTTETPWYIWVLPPMLYLGMVWSLFNLSIKRTFAFSPQLHDPLEYTFTEEKVEARSAAGTGEYEWSQFEFFRELPEWFLLYQNKITFNPIPKSAFASPEEVDGFRRLLEEQTNRGKL